MTDRPIIFSAPMVRALLAGTKTQTRRVLKPQPYVSEAGNLCVLDRDGTVNNWGQNMDGTPCTDNLLRWRVPYAPGNRLWVREAFSYEANIIDDAERLRYVGGVWYRADNDGAPGPWRPSIHMPRWASRLTLTVTDVRVQRVQDISEEDAQAEGVKPWPFGDHVPIGFMEFPQERVPARAAFAVLWDHIHNDRREHRWGANPWVAGISFTVERANIDAAAARVEG